MTENKEIFEFLTRHFLHETCSNRWSGEIILFVTHSTRVAMRDRIFIFSRILHFKTVNSEYHSKWTINGEMYKPIIMVPWNYRWIEDNIFNVIVIWEGPYFSLSNFNLEKPHNIKMLYVYLKILSHSFQSKCGFVLLFWIRTLKLSAYDWLNEFHIEPAIWRHKIENSLKWTNKIEKKRREEKAKLREKEREKEDKEIGRKRERGRNLTSISNIAESVYILSFALFFYP